MSTILGSTIYRRLLVALFVAAFTLFLFTNVAMAGFGISPPRIKEDKLVPGIELERVIYLVQGAPEKDILIKVEVDDSEIKEWLTFEPGLQFVIPKGTQQFPLKVFINVPDDEELGIYKTYIRIKKGVIEGGAEGFEGGGSGVSVSTGAAAVVELTVGDDVFYKFKFRNVDLASIKETEFPKAVVTIENMGNVPAGPQRADFELFNNYGDIRLAYVQGVEMKRVKAFKTKTVYAEFPVGVKLSVGEYIGNVRLYDNDKMVREFEDIFNVEEATFLDKYGVYVGGAVVLIVILILVKLLFFRGKKKKRRNGRS